MRKFVLVILRVLKSDRSVVIWKLVIHGRFCMVNVGIFRHMTGGSGYLPMQALCKHYPPSSPVDDAPKTLLTVYSRDSPLPFERHRDFWYQRISGKGG
jgi:hypothetical protein